MKVAYLGPANTFTGTAARNLFPQDELVPLLPMRNVVMAVESGKFERAVVPLENIYKGQVAHTWDALTKCEYTKIIQEKSFEIVHCLGALAGHRKINRVYSKDQALDQCEDYLYTNFPEAELITRASTAEAAEYIARLKELESAVIAPEAALRESGLEIIAKDICPNNRTRFNVLGKEDTYSTGDDKTILAIHPPARDEPGVLADCLNIIKSQHINLEWIHSRPDRNKGYYFYVELDGHERDEKVRTAILALRYSLDPEHQHSDTIKILGSFANSHWKDEN